MGQSVGTVRLTKAPHGVVIDVQVRGLPAGPHGTHIHAVDTYADAVAGFKVSQGTSLATLASMACWTSTGRKLAISQSLRRARRSRAHPVRFDAVFTSRLGWSSEAAEREWQCHTHSRELKRSHYPADWRHRLQDCLRCKSRRAVGMVQDAAGGHMLTARTRGVELCPRVSNVPTTSRRGCGNIVCGDAREVR